MSLGKKEKMIYSSPFNAQMSKTSKSSACQQWIGRKSADNWVETNTLGSNEVDLVIKRT